MRVALAQLRSTTDPAASLRAVADWAGRAAEGGADLVVFPEATMCSFERASAEVAEPADGPWAGAVRGLASELGVTIAVGMFTTAPNGRVYNTLLVAGAAEARYDKVHLFDALGQGDERDQIRPVLLVVVGQDVVDQGAGFLRHCGGGIVVHGTFLLW